MPLFKATYSKNDECGTYFVRCCNDPTIEKMIIGKRSYEMWKRLHSKKCSCFKNKSGELKRAQPKIPTAYKDGRAKMDFASIKKHIQKVEE